MIHLETNIIIERLVRGNFSNVYILNWQIFWNGLQDHVKSRDTNEAVSQGMVFKDLFSRQSNISFIWYCNAQWYDLM